MDIEDVKGAVRRKMEFVVSYLIDSYVAIYLHCCLRWSISAEPYGLEEKFTVIISMLNSFAYQWPAD